MLRVLLVVVMMNLGVGSALLPPVGTHNHDGSAGTLVASIVSSVELSHGHMAPGDFHQDSHNHSDDSHSHDCPKCSNHCHSSHCFQILTEVVSSLAASNTGFGLYVDYEMVIPEGISSSPFRPPIV